MFLKTLLKVPNGLDKHFSSISFLKITFFYGPVPKLRLDLKGDLRMQNGIVGHLERF